MVLRRGKTTKVTFFRKFTAKLIEMARENRIKVIIPS